MTGITPILPTVAPENLPLTSAVKKLAGLLWYNLLSEMNKNGLSGNALGVGGNAMQSMFLWHIAQTDFTKYDQPLTAATVSQLGGKLAAALPAPVPTMPAMPLAAPAAPAAPAATFGAVLGAAAPAVAAASSVSPLLAQATNFARAIWPALTQAAGRLGVPAPALLAQAALETGWGTAMAGNNLFGIKAADGQSSTIRPTHEVVDGVLTAQNAAFRDYPTSTASVADYTTHIENDFSSALGQTSVNGFARALQSSGYATDINYANKIINISQSPLMARVLQSLGTSATSPAL